MTSDRVIAEVLREAWPDHCKILGEHAVQEIAARASGGEQPGYTPASGGHNIDPSVLLSILSDFASLVASVISVAVLVRARSTVATTKTEDEQVEELMERLPDRHGLDEEKMRSLCALVLKRLSKPPPDDN